MFPKLIFPYPEYVLIDFGGPGGNRTRVRKPLPRSFSHHSCLFEFPRQSGKQQPHRFGSFIIRPQAQSFACVVSCDHDAGLPGAQVRPGRRVASGHC